MSEPLISFTVVGYNYNFEWHCFINSLLLQTDDRWICQLWNDGPDERAREICEYYVDQFSDKFSYHETPERFNDWGHSLRQMGLEQTETKYWSTQNADNYLMPAFVELALKGIIKTDVDLLIFPCVHNYANVNKRGDPPYSLLITEPRKNRCDAGSMIVRTSKAQDVGWNHRFEQADGAFIDEVMASQARWSKIPNILMVHN